MYPSLVSLLKEHQQSIDSLHVLRGDSRKLISPKTRRVTVAFRGQNDQTHKFVQFALALPTLDSLSILFLEGWTLKVHRYWGDGHNISAFRDQKIVARTLMLDGCMPDTFDSALPYVFDLSRVTKLALSGCKLDLLQHLSSSCELRNLTDFGVRTPEHFDETAGENARALFLKNQSLQHLRLHINGLHSVSLDPQDTPDATPYLWPLHPRLKTLSLLDLYREGDNEHFPFIVEPELQQICSHFSALEQLGLCFYDFDIPRSEAEKRFSYVIKILVSSDCFPVLPTAAFMTYFRNQSKDSRISRSYIFTRTELGLFVHPLLKCIFAKFIKSSLHGSSGGRIIDVLYLRFSYGVLMKRIFTKRRGR